MGGEVTCFLTLHNLFLDCVSHFYEKPALLYHLSQNKHQKGGCQKSLNWLLGKSTYRETHMALPVMGSHSLNHKRWEREG